MRIGSASLPDQNAATSPAASTRFYQLDSLRGLAAYSVVLHHYYILHFSPTANSNIGRLPRAGLNLLRPFYAGHEAVVLFFMLSGFVLSMPYLQNKGQPYFIFLVRRILRIYLPYLGALALAIAGVCTWHADHVFPVWGAIWTHVPSTSLVLQHVLFLGVYDYAQLDPVIWSLVYEMRISIIFPFLFLLVNRMSILAALSFALLCSVITILGSGSPESAVNLLYTLHYIGLFVVGILLAKNRKAVAVSYRRLGRAPKVGFFALSAVLFTYSGIAVLQHALERHLRIPGAILTDWITAIGAAGYIVIALNSETSARWLVKKPILFLGHISYSLYLMHCLVLLVMLSTLRGRLPVFVDLPLYVALSLLGGTALYYLVERSSLRLSHLVGRKKAAKAL